jgi:hypothetical protein
MDDWISSLLMLFIFFSGPHPTPAEHRNPLGKLRYGAYSCPFFHSPFAPALVFLASRVAAGHRLVEWSRWWWGAAVTQGADCSAPVGGFDDTPVMPHPLQTMHPHPYIYHHMFVKVTPTSTTICSFSCLCFAPMFLCGFPASNSTKRSIDWHLVACSWIRTVLLSYWLENDWLAWAPSCFIYFY